MKFQALDAVAVLVCVAVVYNAWNVSKAERIERMRKYKEAVKMRSDLGFV